MENKKKSSSVRKHMKKIMCVLYRVQLLSIGYLFCIKHLTVEHITGIFPAVLDQLLHSSPGRRFTSGWTGKSEDCSFQSKDCSFPSSLSGWSETELWPLSNLRTAVFSVLLGRKPEFLTSQTIFSPLLWPVGDFREGRIGCLPAGAPEIDGECVSRMETGFWGLGDLPAGPVVKISPSNAGRGGSIPGGGAKTPHALL